MSWWDTLFDLGSSAIGFAKENPALTGAALGLVTGGFKGDYGENNLRNAATGAALGYTAGKIYDYASPQGVTGLPAVGAGQNGAASYVPGAAVPSEIGAGGLSATTVSAPAAASMTAGSSGIDMPDILTARGDDLMSRSAALAPRGIETVGVMDKVKGGLETVRQFGKDYGDVADIGLKIGSALQGKENAAKQREMMDRYAAQRDQAAAENRAITDKRNALTQQRADEYMAMDPNRYGARAYASTVAGAREKADAAEAAEMSKGYSPATAAANKRRALLGASTSGVTAADSAWNKVESTRRAGLSSISYDKYDAPSYDANYIKTLGDTANAETQGVYKLGEDILGINKTKAKEQVQQDQLDR